MGMTLHTFCLVKSSSLKEENLGQIYVSEDLKKHTNMPSKREQCPSSLMWCIVLVTRMPGYRNLDWVSHSFRVLKASFCCPLVEDVAAYECDSNSEPQNRPFSLFLEASRISI